MTIFPPAPDDAGAQGVFDALDSFPAHLGNPAFTPTVIAC